MVQQLHPGDILAWAERLGIELSVVGDRIRYSPLEAATEEFVAALRTHKPAVLAVLASPEPTGAAMAESADAAVRLGHRLAAREIAGLTCDITGRVCRACAGVPCFGSEPLAWENARGSGQ